MAKPIFVTNAPHDGAGGYPGQVTWIQACYAYRVVSIAVGRQVGKTTTVGFLFLEEPAHHKGFYYGAYMAQGHPQAREMYGKCLEAYEGGKIVKASRDNGQDRWIELIAYNNNKGAKIYFVSGDEEAHIGFQGKALHRGVADEASHLPEAAYSATMVPMFNATKGRALILGSPYPEGIGFDWFERIWRKGDLDNPDRDPDYISFNAPSESNPHGDKWIIKSGRDGAINRQFEMCLYDGLFAKDTGAVFTNLEANFSIKGYKDEGNVWVSEQYTPKHRYVAGLDFGSVKDYSVLTIFTNEPHPRQVLLARFRGDLTPQLVAIDKILARYNKPLIYVEGHESGVMISQMMRQKYGDACRVVKWSRGGQWDKESSVLRGQDFFQSAGWSLMDIKWQRDEFRLFSRVARSKKNIGSSGFQYGAPNGCHDDAVAACLYAAYGLPLVHGAKLVLADETPKPMTAEWWDLIRKTQRKSYFTDNLGNLPY